MKPMFIVLLVVVILTGGWLVSRDKKTLQQSDGVTAQTEEMPSTDSTPQTAQPAVGSATVASTTMTLVISSPADGATVSQSSVTIRGKTKANAEVFVNDEETVADTSGNFSVTLVLDEGDNPIVISANDADGNVAEEELIVYYDAG